MKVYLKEVPDKKCLCETCRWSSIIKGERLGDIIVICGGTPDAIAPPFTVAFCNRYEKIGMPSLHDMKKTAWVLDSSSRKVGFVRPSDLSDKVKREVEDL